MRTRIHVNQHIIKSNSRNEHQAPPLTVKDYRQNRKASTAEIVVDGSVVATVVYRPDSPLACGAKCWVETDAEVRVD